MQNILPEYAVEASSIEQILLGFLLVVALSLMIRWHYLHFSSVFANRSHLANILPLIAAVTLLVISVVKSSLALSLGLVGAMSIVRFRTPIKEPEELGYLFLAIGLGLGAGAGQFLATSVIVISILTFMTLLKRYAVTRNMGDFDFFVEVEGSNEPQSSLADRIIEAMAEKSSTLNLSKFENSDQTLLIGATIGLGSHNEIVDLVAKIRAIEPAARCTFIDHKAVSL
jgi:uncharacterized membrane protein YhiD involved in acid resistance